MCGILGHTAFGRIGLERSRRALNTLAHRGPDHRDDWQDGKVYLGHRRLSVIDLSVRGSQPMSTPDGRIQLIANGEIYNFRTLRCELRHRHEFRTESDSEVLLHGYAEWGIGGLLARLEGMFAFSIYDRNKAMVYLARDRVGIKPLYYAAARGEVLWASELKAVIAAQGVEALRVDETALYDFLTYLYVPTPKTLYRDVFKLRPAHYLEIEVDTGSCREHRYWELSTEVRECALEEAAERTRDVIGRSVGLQMYSDVPVGFFLSGGMDSSIVVKEACGHSTDVHTHCIGFNARGRSECEFARLVAERFGTCHRSQTFDAELLDFGLDSLRQWYDEPFADTSAFPTYQVSRFARETSTVVLTGDGGDELFGGYPRYRPRRRFVGAGRFALPRLSEIRKKGRSTLAGRVANRIELHLLDELELFTRLIGGMLKANKREFARLLRIDEEYDDYWQFREYYRPDLPRRTRLQYLDFHTYLPDDILTKVDRASMAVSLEARVPLLGTEVVECAFSVPEPIRYHGGRRKGLLKHAYRDRLPPEIIGRGKRGFSIPLPLGGSFPGRGQLKQEAIIRRLFAPELPSVG